MFLDSTQESWMIITNLGLSFKFDLNADNAKVWANEHTCLSNPEPTAVSSSANLLSNSAIYRYKDTHQKKDISNSNRLTLSLIRLGNMRNLSLGKCGEPWRTL